MHRAVAIVFALLVAFALSACGGDDGVPEAVCDPGEALVCLCEDGREGTAPCRDDGFGYASCSCGRVLPDTGGGDDAGPHDTGDDAPVVDAGDDTGEPDSGERDSGEPDATDPDTTDPDTGEPDTPEPDGGEPDTSDPDTGVSALPLGADCERSVECVTGICLEVNVGGRPAAVCTQPCCHEESCPIGFGCQQLQASRYCLPARIYPAGTTFSTRTGDPCTSAGQCRSGICDQSAGFCRGTCCTDAECLAAPCHWSLTGSSLRTFCDPLAILGGDGRTGQACFSENDCRSGICVPYPDGARCADLCCSTRTCGGGTVCGLVQGIGPSYVRGCVAASGGATPNGGSCSVDGDCIDNNCIEGTCRGLCCTDTDCLGGDVCRPRITTEGVVATFCVAPE